MRKVETVYRLEAERQRIGGRGAYRKRDFRFRERQYVVSLAAGYREYGERRFRLGIDQRFHAVAAAAGSKQSTGLFMSVACHDSQRRCLRCRGRSLAGKHFFCEYYFLFLRFRVEFHEERLHRLYPRYRSGVSLQFAVYRSGGISVIHFDGRHSLVTGYEGGDVDAAHERISHKETLRGRSGFRLDAYRQRQHVGIHAACRAFVFEGQRLVAVRPLVLIYETSVVSAVKLFAR